MEDLVERRNRKRTYFDHLLGNLIAAATTASAYIHDPRKFEPGPMMDLARQLREQRRIPPMARVRAAPPPMAQEREFDAEIRELEAQAEAELRADGIIGD